MSPIDRSATSIHGDSPSQCHFRRDEILHNMQVIMGPLPGPEKCCPLDMQISEEVDKGEYIQQTITYSSELGSRTPGYLLLPKRAHQNQCQSPAVLALHSTNDNYGYEVVVGLHDTPGRNYGQELARLGYVVLAPNYPLMAKYQPDLSALGYTSGTMKAIWDNIRGIDLLLSLPYVTGQSVAAIGHSLGGHNALFTAAFNNRISTVVTSCGFDSFADYKDGDLTGWTQQRYMPKLATYPSSATPFDFHEVLAAIAPRPVYVSAPLHDKNFKAGSVARIQKAVSKIYELYNASEKFQVDYPDCDHDFPQSIRTKAYRFIRQHQVI